MPEATREILARTFARLQQRVVWKWEEPERFPEIPGNVKLAKWLPQQDLLGHSKIRLFLTHGGLFSVQEAIYHAVPLVGLPVFADQPSNMNKVHKDGYGIYLRWDQLTEEILYGAIQRILTEPRYGNLPAPPASNVLQLDLLFTQVQAQGRPKVVLVPGSGGTPAPASRLLGRIRHQTPRSTSSENNLSPNDLFAKILARRPHPSARRMPGTTLGHVHLPSNTPSHKNRRDSKTKSSKQPTFSKEIQLNHSINFNFNLKKKS